MKLLLKIVLLLLLTGVLLGGEQGLMAQPVSSPWGELSTEMFPLSKPPKGGPIQLSLTIVLEVDCDSTNVMVIPSGNIVYVGQEEWNIVDAAKGQVYNYLLDVVVPQDDTTGISVMVTGEGSAHPGCYFVTTGDTLEVWPGTPRDYYRYTGVPKFDGIRRGHVRAGEFPELDSLYGVPPDPYDSVYEKATTRQVFSIEELQLQKMRKLEEAPLTETDYQIVSVGKVKYGRSRGETEFHVLEPITDDYKQRRRDSLLANPPDNDYDVVLDLRDPAHYRLATELIDNLIPTDSAGYYKAITKRPILRELRENGINYECYKVIPRPGRDADKSEKSSGESYLPQPK